MNPSRWAAPVRRFVFVLTLIPAAIAVRPRPAAAQVLDPKLFVTNGTVYAVASLGDTLYAGGNFTEVGRATGGAAAFDPVAGDIIGSLPTVLGQVHTIISDGAGGCYIGGQFTHVGGQPRENLAHITSANLVDSWNPGANNEVYALCLNPNGNLYVGGSFTQVAGTPRNRIAEIRTNVTLTSFAPSMDAPVRAIALSGSDVVIGGDFTSIGGTTPRSHIAMISRLGVVYAWNPGVSGPVYALRVANLNVHGQGVVSCAVVGGSFVTAGGGARNNVAALSLVDGVGAFSTWNPNVNGPVYAFGAAGTDYYLGGNFTNVGGVACTNVAKVDGALGAAYATWTPSVNGEVRAIVYRASASSVVLGGRFSSAGGQARRGLAALNSASPGAATLWNPHPSHDVEALLDDGSRMIAGGLFTAANMVTRNRLASFRRSTGQPTSWNPNADNEVRALLLEVYGSFFVQRVVVGGYFSNVGGAARTRLAKLDPTTGAATSWNPVVAGGGASVRTLCLAGNLLYAGGDFATVNGQSRPGACSFDFSGSLNVWSPNVGANGVVFAMVAVNQWTEMDHMYLGGAFSTVGGVPHSNLARVQLSGIGASDSWAGSVDDYVFDLAFAFGNLYAGGFFQNANGQPRFGAASFDTATGSLNAWNPALDGSVYAIATTDSRIVLGGSFDVSQGFDRQGVVRVDPFVGSPDALNPDVEGSVFSLDVFGPYVLAGGSFPSAQSVAHPNLAMFDENVPPICPSGLVSPAGTSPRALATGDFNADGITDLLVYNELGSLGFSALSMQLGQGTAGVGDGTFAPAGYPLLISSDVQAVAADLDADGFDDVVMTARENNRGHQAGSVFVARNLGDGTFDPNGLIEVELLGHADGLAVGDVTNDGILDVAACLRDSAGLYQRGGIQLLRGTGSNGIWDGGFASAWKFPLGSTAMSARRVILQDFNSDGTLDIFYSGPGFGEYRGLKFAPGGTTPAGIEGRYLLNPAPQVQESGLGLATGDLNGDARAELVVAAQRSVLSWMRLAPDAPASIWFFIPFTLQLESTPREIALLDHDFDGKLDLVCTMDSLSRVEIHRGVGDGSFETAIATSASMNAWGLVVGDFETNGSADLVVSQPECGTVTTLPQTQTSPLVLDLTLTAPNGGEVWAQLPFAEGLNAPAAAAPPSTEIASAPELPVIAGTQLITWNKGNGIAAVDVDVSRDGGHTWQSIGRNQPGSSLLWTVTPPASGAARVRVRDSNVAGRSDGSDALFQIAATTVDVDPSAGLPRVAAIWMLGANPVRGGGAIEFRVDVPRAADVRVDVYDVAGRHVRTLTRGRLDAGTHALAWNAADGSAGGTRLSGPRSGVYFVRALIGDVKTTSKFAVLQ